MLNVDATLSETIDDLHASFVELADANGIEPQYRRSLKRVLDDAYRIYERRGQDLGREAFRLLAEQSLVGKMSLGIVFLRGLSTHHLTQPTSIEELYPSERIFPSEYLYPGTNPTWMEGLDLPAPTGKYEKLNAAHYAATLAGLPALPTLDCAINFLADPT